MKWFHLVILSVLFVVLDATFQKFPSNFKFGASTSAYQIEGAWNVSGKSPSIWDEFTHSAASTVADGSHGDIACNSYTHWREDVRLAKQMGLHFYRFSISWSRLLPSGFANEISADGKKYYSDLINELLNNGIEPVVTLYHMDLPMRLQNFGGWANPLISDWFTSYARVVFSLFADRVKTWITINDPLTICDGGYSGHYAPAVHSPNVGAYLCSKHVLVAHAKVWRMYDKEFRPRYRGKISIVNQIIWLEGANTANVELAELLMQNSVGRFSHPIYSKEGGWPPSLEKFIEENSKKEGHVKSRLPAFTREEIELIRGTYDFFGLSQFSSAIVRTAIPNDKTQPWTLAAPAEFGAALHYREDWPHTSVPWIKVNAKGFRSSLVWVKDRYGDLPILVAEHGYPDRGTLNDRDRTNFFKEHLTQLWLAIKKDKVNVIGYSVWSLMDNFDWTQGYTSKYGLYQVNFTDPLRTRTSRSSAHFYTSVIINHALGTPDDHGSYIVVWIIIAVLLITLVLCAMFIKYYREVKGYKSKRKYENVGLSDISLFPGRS